MSSLVIHVATQKLSQIYLIVLDLVELISTITLW